MKEREKVGNKRGERKIREKRDKCCCKWVPFTLAKIKSRS
jgi:hypothetical protein